MILRTLPSQAALNQRLRYEPETGKLFWRPHPEARQNWRTRHEGKEAFTVKQNNGYMVGTITVPTPEGMQSYRPYAHRAIWLMVHGVEPECIDHINGDRADNRLVNLRCVSRQENATNTRLRNNNKTGYHGVKQLKTGTWVAEIGIMGRNVRLGSYWKLETALIARRAAEKSLGFHENHGQ